MNKAKFCKILLFMLAPFTGMANDTMPLTKVLTELSKHYQVFFSYDIQSLANSKVDFKIIPMEEVDEAIERLFQPLDFAYDKFSNKYYVVYSKGENWTGESFIHKEEKSQNTDKEYNNLFSSILLEKETGLPISDAFIFIRNSSISTTSDLSGFFQLDLGNFSREELVITHLNFQTQSYIIDKTTQLPENIYLRPKNLELAKVEVKSKRIKSRKRKKWLKRFKTAFFGGNYSDKIIAIENPEVVWFREEGRNLKVEAVDYLSIINYQLGYKMRFYLDTFHLDKRKHVVYAGKVFFEDVVGQDVDSEQIRRSRGQAYVNSKKYFFKSMWFKKVNPEEFVFGLGELSDRGKLLDYEEKTVADLPIYRVGNHMVITTNKYLAFANKNIVTEWGASYFMGGKNSYATGLLKPLNGQIIFDQNGNIINAHEVEEYGYWTQKRIANLLPIEYELSASAEDFVDYPSERIQQLNRQLDSQPQEKIYLHLNKPYYSLRDEIYFKAYLTNAENNQPSTLSKVVYVELIDGEKNIVRSWMLHRDKGLSGNFQLKPQLNAGSYTIRAYTEYMRNWDNGYFFEKQFAIYDYSKKSTEEQPEKILTVLTDELDSPANNMVVKFYPEGGDFVEGIVSNVAFEVRDTIGNPMLIEGKIEDENGVVISKVKTTHRGIGKFNFIPEMGKKYSLKCTENGVSYQFELPLALEQGYVLKINNTAADKVFIECFASPQYSLTDAFLVGHVRGKTFCMIQNLSTGTLTIPKETIPTGLAHFTLFDGANRPVAERLFFNDFGIDNLNLKIESESDAFEKRKLVNVLVSLPDSLKGAGNFSASVTDQSIVRYPEFDGNIKTWLWLNSDLTTVIDNPNFYLTSIDKRKRYLLDLLIMTKKWRRFNWQKNNQKLVFPIENGYSISGYTTALGSENRIPSKVNLSALKADFYYEEMLTDEQGNFSFDNILFTDSLAFILQGRLLNATESEQITGKDRAVDFKFTDRTIPEIKLKKFKNGQKEDLFFEKYYAFEKRASLVDSVFKPDWSIDLDSVTVTAGYVLDSRLFGTYNLNKMDWIEPKTTGMQMIRMFATKNVYDIDYATGKIFKWINRLSEPTRIPVHLFINGQETSAIRLLSLEADMIDFFYVDRSNNSAVVSVITRTNGPRSLQAKLENGILNITHPGYHQARTFYAPNYHTTLPEHEKPDYRTAIHWEPNLTFDKNGQTWLQFYTADSPATYELRIEGVSEEGIPIYSQQTIFGDQLISEKE